MLTEFGPADHGCPLVEQPGQRPQQPGLALTAFAEQHEVVTRDQRPLQLGQYGVVETKDPGPDVAGLRALGQRGQQIFAEFLLDSPFTMTGGTQFADGAGQVAR